jgi:GT2 family glycosyltransferase
MKQIAVLLTCHNRREKTLSCLAALYACVLPEGYGFDVFLVDDGCTDGTADAVKAQFSQVKIIQGDGNLFWNRGMRLAWETAAAAKDYDYFLWLNDDTILFADAIKELLESAEKTVNQNIIVGTTCSSEDKKTVTYGGRTKKAGLIKPEGTLQRCEFFNGNIVLIPRFVFQKAGMNDRIFHHALGDFDYGLRATKKGIEILVAPSISGECNEHETISAWCNPNTPIFKRLRLLYSPLGNNPVEFFKFKCRHNGFVLACLIFISNHLKALMPTIYLNKTRK